MSDLKYLPISHLDEAILLPLMEEEEKAWLSDLGWDYSPIRQILVSFVRQKLLPGYVAVNAKKAIGYIYFLVNQAKGIIGAIYLSKSDYSQEAVEQLLSLTISCLKDSPNIQRVEAQIMPFNNLSLTAAFTQHGFGYYPRYYLEMNLHTAAKKTESSSAEKILPWDPSYLERAAELTLISYQNQTDAEICEDYCTRAGCQNYLRSLVENPGCGIFMPEASFISLNQQGTLCGFVICCRISGAIGMIPQIAVHPSCQGRGLGNRLINSSIEALRARDFHSLSLTVTKKNRRAYDWYQRLGFKIRKEFGAYVWNR
jgi:ribosomal protein S18 acetylase RimI-like enzyme